MSAAGGGRGRARVPALLRRGASGAALVALLAACTGFEGDPVAAAPPSAEALHVVLQIGEVGGYVPAPYAAARLPVVTVYSDGRVLIPVPAPATAGVPAVPAIEVHHLDDEGLEELVTLALEAGVAEEADLGSPSVTDQTDTRFVLYTDDVDATREVYALAIGSAPGAGGISGVTPAQAADRQRLSRLIEQFRDLPDALGAARVRGPEPYPAEAVAAITSGFIEPSWGEAPAERPWPGPELGTGALGIAGCTLLTGDDAQQLLDAAADATDRTPWRGPDGQRWSVLVRPLLPHESGCADLPLA